MSHFKYISLFLLALLLIYGGSVFINELISSREALESDLIRKDWRQLRDRMVYLISAIENFYEETGDLPQKTSFTVDILLPTNVHGFAQGCVPDKMSYFSNQEPNLLFPKSFLFDSQILLDPTSIKPNTPICFYGTETADGQMLLAVWGCGMDGDHDISMKDVKDCIENNDCAYLIDLAYDPTNGSISNGDVIRRKALSRNIK